MSMKDLKTALGISRPTVSHLTSTPESASSCATPAARSVALAT